MGRSRRKKHRTHVDVDDKQSPKCLVMARGRGRSALAPLVRDVRSVMEPFTASRLKVRKQNVLKDFVNVAGPLGITNFLIFTQTDVATNLRICRLPRGPTITFKVAEYAIKSDVVALQRRPRSPGSEYMHPALLVLNNMSGDQFHSKLIISMLQNMFPALDVEKVKLSQVRRCCLVNFDAETNSFEFRHYFVHVAPSGLSRGVKKIIKSRIPNLSNVEDIADYVMNQGGLSDSEADEPADANVVLPQKMGGVGNARNQQSLIRLVELGPRMTWQLIKIEEGFCGGKVLHHELVHKSKAEEAQLQSAVVSANKLKAERKKKQAENVKRKAQLREAHRQRCATGQKANNESAMDSEEDDAEYYRKEVGEEPSAEMSMSRKKPTRQPFKERTGGVKRKSSARPPTSSRGETTKRQKTNSGSAKPRGPTPKQQKPNVRLGKPRGPKKWKPLQKKKSRRPPSKSKRPGKRR